MAISRPARPGEPSRGRPCDPRLDKALVASAADELAETGYSRMTMAGVARRAGASTASLYRRWPSKQALVEDAATRLASEALGDVDTGSLRGDLQEILGRKLDALGGARGVALLSLLGQCAHDPHMAEVVQTHVFDVTRLHVTEALRRAGERGDLPARVDAQLLGTLLIGVVLDGLAERARPDRGRTPDGRRTPDGWAVDGDDPRAHALAALDVVLRGCGM